MTEGFNTREIGHAAFVSVAAAVATGLGIFLMLGVFIIHHGAF